MAESIRSIANLKQIIAAQIAGGAGAPIAGASSAAAAASNAGPKKAITQLYADTGLAKLPFILSYLSDLLETGTKFLVFAHHLAVLDGIEALLKKHHRDAYFRLDGSTKPADRQRGVERFQTDPECRVALLSITAGGTGITLTSASTVVFAELQWTPALLVQAEDRVHRIGQFNPVNCYYLVAHHTLDEILWPMLSAKLEVLGHTLDGKENALEVAGVQGEAAKTTPMEFKTVAQGIASSSSNGTAAMFGSSSASASAAASNRWADSSARAEVDLTQADDESEAKHAPSSSGSRSASTSANANQSPPVSSSVSSSKKVTAPSAPFSGWIGMSGGGGGGGSSGSKTVSPFAASALAAAAAGLTRVPASAAVSSSVRALPPAASVSRLLHRDAALSAHMHSTQRARSVSAEIADEVHARFDAHADEGPSAQISSEAQRTQPPPQDAIIELDGADSDDYRSDEY